MQLPKLRPAPAPTFDPFEPPAVSLLDDDPDFIRENALLVAFRARDNRRRQEQERLALEAEFSTKATDTKDGPRAARLRARLTMLNGLPDYFTAPSSDPEPLTIPKPALARGLEMLRGGEAKPEMTRAEKLERLHRDGLVLEEAIRFQAEVVNELRATKSYEVCVALKEHHDAVLLAFFRAAQAFAAVTDRERQFRAAVIEAGYEARHDLIGPPFITASLMLGSEQQHDSQVSTYRRHLQEKGIIS